MFLESLSQRVNTIKSIKQASKIRRAFLNAPHEHLTITADIIKQQCMLVLIMRLMVHPSTISYVVDKLGSINNIVLNV